MSASTSREELQVAIANSVRPGSRPRDVLKVLRKHHPDASSKELALAAFALMIEVADQDTELAAALHEFGLAERGLHDGT